MSIVLFIQNVSLYKMIFKRKENNFNKVNHKEDFKKQIKNQEENFKIIWRNKSENLIT